jgi:hypothetical protein
MTVLIEPFASVYYDRSRLGVIFARGRNGFEAYAADDHSLGLFPVAKFLPKCRVRFRNKTGYLICDIAPVAAISREPERPRDAQDAINGITDIVNGADPIERPPYQPAKGVRISNLAVSALASLIPVDRRLDGGFRLKTGRRVYD